MDSDELLDVDYSEIQPGLQPGEETHGIKRVLRIGLGVILILAGIAMLVLPGQGLLTIIVGLNLIKPDNPLVKWLRARTPGIPEDGPIPRSAIALGIVMFVVFGGVSLLYGQDILNWIRGLF